MRILAWRVPPYDNGAYLVHDERREAIVIDPSMGEAEVLTAAKEEGLRVIEILNTHGHPDHIYGNAAVKEATRARLAIHRLDAYRLDPRARPRVSPESRALNGDPPGSLPHASADDRGLGRPLRCAAHSALAAPHTPR